MKLQYIILSLGLVAAPVEAVQWTQWTESGAGNAGATGNIAGPGVTVTVDGPLTYGQTSVPSPATWWSYLGTPWQAFETNPNRPPDSGIVAPSAGVHSITFSRPVKGVWLNVLSLGQTFSDYYVRWSFDRPFEVLGHGLSYYGDGDLFDAGRNVLEGHEGSGVVYFSGRLDKLTFSMDREENWSGFTVGIDAVPEPATWGLMLAGFAQIGWMMRRRAVAVRA